MPIKIPSAEVRSAEDAEAALHSLRGHGRLRADKPTAKQHLHWSAQFKKRTLSFPLTRMVSIFKKYTAFHLICILEYFPAPICH